MKCGTSHICVQFVRSGWNVVFLRCPVNVVFLSCTCSIRVVTLHWPDIFLLYISFFFGGEIEMTDSMNLLCWYIFIINAMRSCNERTTLHCGESLKLKYCVIKRISHYSIDAPGQLLKVSVAYWAPTVMSVPQKALKKIKCSLPKKKKNIDEWLILLKNTILLMKSQLVTSYTLKYDVNRCFWNNNNHKAS
jgi:hypothetical protein